MEIENADEEKFKGPKLSFSPLTKNYAKKAFIGRLPFPTKLNASEVQPIRAISGETLLGPQTRLPNTVSIKKMFWS
jgi:hypothetical protein